MQGFWQKIENVVRSEKEVLWLVKFLILGECLKVRRKEVVFYFKVKFKVNIILMLKGKKKFSQLVV